MYTGSSRLLELGKTRCIRHLDTFRRLRSAFRCEWRAALDIYRFDHYKYYFKLQTTCEQKENARAIRRLFACARRARLAALR